jgi:DNA polymerase-3 subunit epsilon
MAGLQRSFDDLGTPLIEVTFCVIDLETTGGSPATEEITEIGAVKVRGGEVLGSFHTLVNPGREIPPSITVLTGITQAMVLPAPHIDEVLPALLEFIGGAVIVCHNVRFDVSFLDAALTRSGRPQLANTTVDTWPLAKRLVRDEVPNCKLGTLAERLRLDHRPSHRALDDALATADLLHVLIERAAGLGVTGLDDLAALPTIKGHAQAHKLSMTTGLPRRPGVYRFVDRRGTTLYVGKATNLRARVRSYFSGDTRRKIGPMLREAHAVEHEVAATALEAAVRELRLIRELQPRYNRQGRDPGKYRYVRLTLSEDFPRLAVATVVRPRDLHLGPVSSTAAARRIIEAVQSAVPLRRCTDRPGRAQRGAPCTAAQLGVATCPCSGSIDRDAYRRHVELAAEALTTRPDVVFGPLARRMEQLAGDERFEEATDIRDRADALAGALARHRRLDALRRAGRLVVEVPGEGGAEICGGLLVRSWGRAGEPSLPLHHHGVEPPPPGEPLPADLVDEVTCVARWLEDRAERVVLLHAEHGWSVDLPHIPRFAPSGGRDDAGRGAPGERGRYSATDARRPAPRRADRAGDHPRADHHGDADRRLAAPAPQPPEPEGADHRAA